MRKIFALLLLVALTACSKEPSANDLERAVQGQYDTFNAQSAAAGATSPASKFILHSARKIACRQVADPKTYDCDVEVDVTTPLIGRSKSVKTIKLADKDSHWQVLNWF